MPEYEVTVIRQTEERTTIMVRATDEDDAQNKAIECCTIGADEIPWELVDVHHWTDEAEEPKPT